MGMIMQDVTELKSIVKNAAGLEGLPVHFVSIKDDPDLYGDATESNYLPIIIGNPPINMFLEITLTDNGTVEYHYEIIFDGGIIDDYDSSFDDADAEQEIWGVVRGLKNHINTGGVMLF